MRPSHTKRYCLWLLFTVLTLPCSLAEHSPRCSIIYHQCKQQSSKCSVPLIVAPNTAASSYRKPTSAGTSRGNFRDQRHGKTHSFYKIYKNEKLQCVDKPTRCNTSYELSLFSIIWLYMFGTITSPSSGASSHKLYNALVCSCRRV